MKTIESHRPNVQETTPGCSLELNGVPYSILNHGDLLPLSTNNFAEIAKDISTLSHPLVSVDGYFSDGNMPSINSSSTSFPLIEAISQTGGSLIGADFFSIKSQEEFEEDKADKTRKLLAAGITSSLIIGGKMMYDSRKTPVKRRTAIKGIGLSLVAGAIGTLSFRAAVNWGRENRLDHMEKCEPHAFFDAQDAANFDPNFMDLVARTTFSSIKMKNLPPSELITRALPTTAPKRLVYGRNHFTRKAIEASNQMLLDPISAVDFIVLENAVLGILQGYDETTVKNYLTTLQINLSASLFYHPVKTSEGYKFEPIYSSDRKAAYYIDPVLFPPAARTQDANTLKAYADALSGVYYNSASKMAKTLQ